MGKAKIDKVEEVNLPDGFGLDSPFADLEKRMKLERELFTAAKQLMYHDGFYIGEGPDVPNTQDEANEVWNNFVDAVKSLEDCKSE